MSAMDREQMVEQRAKALRDLWNGRKLRPEEASISGSTRDAYLRIARSELEREARLVDGLDTARMWSSGAPSAAMRWT